jgi:uncharacterized membrane protein YgdD (TMEM256/DUF423 family)
MVGMWFVLTALSGLISVAAFMLGIILFCGSLYYMGVTGNRSAALVTPYGGMTLMAGWLLLAICGVAWRGRLRSPAPTKP